MLPALVHTVTPEEDGMLLRTLLRQRLGLSAGVLRRAKRLPGGITVGGQPAFVTVTVRAGDRVEILLDGGESSRSVAPTPGTPDLRYEDEHLLVVCKPAGLCVHPGPGHASDSLGNLLRWHYQSRGLPFTLRPVNRLDRGTSGLLVFARHPQAQTELARQMTQGGYQRTYYAVCLGVPPRDAGTVDLPIGRAPDSALRRRVDPGGQRAVTHYEVLARGDGASLLRLGLDTGRTHQIRVHMSALGCPLAGDFLYGREDPDLIPHTALHAGELRFLHPMTGEPMGFSAGPPEEFLRCLDRLSLTPPPGTFSGSPCPPGDDAGPCSPPAPPSR